MGCLLLWWRADSRGGIRAGNYVSLARTSTGEGERTYPDRTGRMGRADSYGSELAEWLRERLGGGGLQVPAEASAWRIVLPKLEKDRTELDKSRQRHAALGRTPPPGKPVDSSGPRAGI